MNQIYLPLEIEVCNLNLDSGPILDEFGNYGAMLC